MVPSASSTHGVASRGHHSPPPHHEQLPIRRQADRRSLGGLRGNVGISLGAAVEEHLEEFALERSTQRPLRDRRWSESLRRLCSGNQIMSL